MSKFLKIVNEYSQEIHEDDNPHAIFYIKLLDNKGRDIGYEPIELRGTTYADDLFRKLKHLIESGEGIHADGEEDNEVYAGAEVLGDMGDTAAKSKLDQLRRVAKTKKSAVLAGLNNLISKLTSYQNV